MAEQRRHPRFAVSVAVDVSTPSGVERCEAENLAPGGCRVAAPVPMRVGTLVRVRIRSPRVGFEIAGEALVAWSSGEPPHRAGLAFAPDLVDDATRFLNALVGSGK